MPTNFLRRILDAWGVLTTDRARRHLCAAANLDYDQDGGKPLVRLAYLASEARADLEAELMSAFTPDDGIDGNCDTCGMFAYTLVYGQCRACYYDEDSDYEPDDDYDTHPTTLTTGDTT